jgi:hypothetical protein
MRMGKRVFWREIWKRVRESPRVAKLGFDLLTWDACEALIPGNLDNGEGVSKHTFCCGVAVRRDVAF